MTDRQQAEIERWIEVTGRQYPDAVTYTQDEAHFWHMKTDEKDTECARLREEVAALNNAMELKRHKANAEIAQLRAKNYELREALDEIAGWCRAATAEVDELPREPTKVTEQTNPCPFCGRGPEGLHAKTEAYNAPIYIWCGYCGAHGPECPVPFPAGDSFDEKAVEAWRAWNARPEGDIA